MGEANDTGSEEEEDTSGSEDSAVIRALRKELKQANKATEVALADKASIAETTRSEIERGRAAATIVNALGYPLMADDFASQVEGDLTEELAVTFLQGKGLEPKTTDATDDEDTKDDSPAVLAAKLAATTSLGSALADAASGSGAKGAAERAEAKVDKATNAAEVAAVMRAAGLQN